MKNLFKNLMLVAVAAMAFTACTENNDEVNATKRDAILKFSTSFAETRVTIGNEKNEDGEYPVTWDGDEDVRFDIQDGGWWTNLESEMVVDSEDARNASFEVVLSGNAENASADAGSIIYAYFGKLDGSRNAYISGQTQTPQVGGVDKSFISMVAEFPVEVEGQMDFNGTFNHKTAYGLITLPSSVEDVEFKSLSVKVNNEKEYLLNVNGLDTHSYWFACEPGAVSSIIISAVDSGDAVYGYTATGLNKTFTAGRVAKFSIKSLETDATEPVELGTPNVTATVNGAIATLSWEAVENASGYAVSVMGADYENIGEATEYTVDLSNYPPFSYVYVYVKAVGVDLFLDSQDATVSVMSPVTKESNGDNGFVFDYDSAELRGTDKYKFYNSAESKEYMYLYFDRDITTLEPGSYTYKLGSGVNGGTADSAYRHPNYTNGDYVEYWFQGEFVAFVDVTADGVYSITVFCKRWVENGEYLFKGYWSGKLPKAKLETPQNLNATVSDSTINVTWSAVANATGYEVSFNGETNTTTETSYSFADVEPGDYTIEVVAKADNFDTSAVASVNVTVKAPAAAAFTSAEVAADDGAEKYITFNCDNGALQSLTIDIANAFAENDTMLREGTYTHDALMQDGKIFASDSYYGYDRLSTISMTVTYVPEGYYIVFENVREYYDEYILFERATYTGAISGLVTPGVGGGDEPVNPEPEPEPEPEASASATLVTGTTFGGFNPYDVTFSFENGDKVVVRFNTSGNQYLHLGAWQTNNWEDPHYISGAEFNGAYALVTACNVAYENDAYIVTMSVYEYTNYTTTEYTYTGAIEGLNAPEACDCIEEPEEVVLPEFVIPGEGGTYTYDFRYTKLVDGLDATNAIRVAQDNGWIWDIKFNPGLSSIVPGDYTAVGSFSTANALEVDTFNGSVQYGNNYQFFYPDSYSDVSINVQQEGEFYCITLIGANGYSAEGKTYRCVYIGKIQ